MKPIKSTGGDNSIENPYPALVLRRQNDYGDDNDDHDDMMETSSFIREMLGGEDMPFVSSRPNSTQPNRRRETRTTYKERQTIYDHPKRIANNTERFLPGHDRVNQGQKPKKGSFEDSSKPSKDADNARSLINPETHESPYSQQNPESTQNLNPPSFFQSPILPQEVSPPPPLDASSITIFNVFKSSQRTVPRKVRISGQETEQFFLTGIKDISPKSSSMSYVQLCICCCQEFGKVKMSSLIRCPHCSQVQPNDSCNSRCIFSHKKEHQKRFDMECCIFRKKYLSSSNPYNAACTGMDAASKLYVEQYFREDSSRVCRDCLKFYGHKYGGRLT